MNFPRNAMDRRVSKERTKRPESDRPGEKDLWLAVTALMDGAHRAWATYILWFTAFFSANLLGLSWFFLRNNSAILSDRNRVALCVVWIVFNFSGVISSFVLARYSLVVHRRVKKILVAINNPVAGTADEYTPEILTIWAAIANGNALFVNAVIWAYIMFRR